jgi:hypothetical protein
VAEVVISIEQPASLSKSEVRAWVNERTRAGPPAITLDAADRAERGALVLRVEAPEDWTGAVEDQIADLMMDMRLLGLRPTIVPPSSLQRSG